jgi:hypothetical protein
MVLDIKKLLMRVMWNGIQSVQYLDVEGFFFKP